MMRAVSFPRSCDSDLHRMAEADAPEVFNEGASTYTGSAAKLSVPIGLMTRSIPDIRAWLTQAP